MFICHNCSFETDAAVRYLKHVRAHSNENVLPCGVPHCKKKFRTFSAFTCHVSRYHRLLQHQKRLSYLQNVGIHVKCNVESCQKTCHLTEFLKHLKGHIDAGIKLIAQYLTVDDHSSIRLHLHLIFHETSWI